MQNHEMTKYTASDPYGHQLECFDMFKDQRYGGILLPMGTGKTLIYISLAVKAYFEEKITGILFLAPKGSYGNFTQEFAKHAPENLQYDMVQWTGQSGKKEEELKTLFERGNKLKVFVVNLEALSRKKTRALNWCTRFVIIHKASVAVDEASKIKNMSAITTGNTIDLGKKAVHKFIITGSGITNSPMDLWAPTQFLDPRALGFDSFYSFRGTFCELGKDFTYVAGKKKEFIAVKGYRKLDKLRELLDRFCYIKTKEQCVDLPPKIYTKRFVDMHPEQAALYKEFEKELIILVNDQTVSASVVLTKLMKLQQIANGYVSDDDKNLHEIPNGRLEALLEALDEIEGKVIIWVPFRPLIKIISEAIKKKYGQNSYVTYFGDTDAADRIANVKRFQEDAECRYFVGNPSVGGYSITLTASHDVIYYANNYSADQRWQSEDRCHRIGQDSPVTYVDLICRGTIDSRILKVLQQKRDIASLVMGDKKQVMQFLTHDPQDEEVF